MASRFVVFFFLFVTIFQYAQTRIKVMTFNLMHYPGTYYYDEATNSFKDRTYVLKSILDSYQPDIFSVCELQNATGAEQILNIALATQDNRYNNTTFVSNHSSGNTSLQQLIFYNTQKLNLVYQDFIQTEIRDINHYGFQLNTGEADVFLSVFVAHLKASNTYQDEQKRWEMVSHFTSYLNNMDSESNVIFTGDFNFYDSYESGYQEIIDPNNNIVMVDPINMPGYWSNNSTYTGIHTQSPITTNGHFHYSSTGGTDGVTGGMDDRFDFIMLSQNMMSSANLTYVPDTYKAYGNNGNCYNSYISNTSCNGTYSQELRNLLFNMSDHIPVVLELETPYALNNQEFLAANYVRFSNGNIQNKELWLRVPIQFLNSDYKIFNYLGQVLTNGKLNESVQKIDITHLNQGVYFLKIQNVNPTLKFIKI